MAERAQLLTQKLELLKKMAEETERMGILLQNNDLDALAVCIEQKSGYIERVNDIDRQLEGFAAQVGEEPLRAEIARTLQALMEADRRNTALAEHIRTGFTTQIRGVNRERSLMAYGTTPAGSKFVDREG